MGGAHSNRIPIDGRDWMRDVEKRVLHEERRPTIRTASDLMGPGLGPYAVEVMDWNGPETAFNGFYYSEPGAINSPDSTKYWMGFTEGNTSGYGLQRLYQATPDGTIAVPPASYIRSFWPGFQRQFSNWGSMGAVLPNLTWFDVVDPTTDIRPSTTHVMWVGGTTKPVNMAVNDLWVKKVP
jgi:hypothetical protein